MSKKYKIRKQKKSKRYIKQEEKNKSRMRRCYQVQTKYFPNGNEQGVIFGIKKMGEKKIVHIPALELFKNDALLKKFSIQDVRTIVYTAALESFLLEKKYLKQVRN